MEQSVKLEMKVTILTEQDENGKLTSLVPRIHFGTAEAGKKKYNLSKSWNGAIIMIEDVTTKKIYALGYYDFLEALYEAKQI